MGYEGIRLKKGSHASKRSRLGFTPTPMNTNTPQSPLIQHHRNLGNQAVQRLMASGAIQAKLKIGQPNDTYEQEADRVADQVMRMAEPGIQRQSTCPECMEEEEELIQTKPLAEQITPLVQRQIAPEEEEEEELIQTKGEDGTTPQAASGMESRIQSLKSGGQSLPESTRSFFEPRFGADFSRVRVHDGAEAAYAARSVNAKAFTTGKHMIFGTGQYSPQTHGGRRLLAHELTHVVQNSKQPNRARRDTEIRRVVQIPNNQVSFRVTQRPTVNVPAINPPDADITANDIIMNGQARITGVVGDNCLGHQFGFLQTEWIETNKAYYRGRLNRHGSVMVRRDRPPSRPRGACSDTSIAGQFWTDDPGETQQVACNNNINITSRDGPSDSFPLVEHNATTGQDNYLRELYMEFMFVTVFSVRRPDTTFRHFRSVYWNNRWFYRFTLTNFAAPLTAASWTVREFGSHTGAAASGIISGGSTDPRVPMFTVAQANNCNVIANNAAANPARQESNRW